MWKRTVAEIQFQFRCKCKEPTKMQKEISSWGYRCCGRAWRRLSRPVLRHVEALQGRVRCPEDHHQRVRVLRGQVVQGRAGKSRENLHVGWDDWIWICIYLIVIFSKCVIFQTKGDEEREATTQTKQALVSQPRCGLLLASTVLQLFCLCHT